MNSRWFGVLTLALSLALLAGASAANRPNVVLIITDDQRWDALSCSGNPFLKTPNIDRIANEGARFKNAFCTTSLCSPSRASMLIFTSDNGLLNGEHGMVDKRTMHEPSIRVPLIVRYPPLVPTNKPRVIEQQVLNVDMAPSILDVWRRSRSRTFTGVRGSRCCKARRAGGATVGSMNTITRSNSLTRRTCAAFAPTIGNTFTTRPATAAQIGTKLNSIT